MSFISFCRHCQLTFFKSCVTSTNLADREDSGEQVGLKNIGFCLESYSYYQLVISVVYCLCLVRNHRSLLWVEVGEKPFTEYISQVPWLWAHKELNTETSLLFFPKFLPTPEDEEGRGEASPLPRIFFLPAADLSVGQVMAILDFGFHLSGQVFVKRVTYIYFSMFLSPF